MQAVPRARYHGADPSEQGVVQLVHYSNPDYMPPVINQIRLLAERGWLVDVLSRDYAGSWDVAYPPEARIHRLSVPAGRSGSEYVRFVAAVLRCAHPRAVAVIGHDMHGFLAARLLAWRRRIPLVYHSHDLVEVTPSMSMGARAVKALEVSLARTADAVVVPDPDRAAVAARALHLRCAPLVIANAPLSTIDVRDGRLGAALAERGRHFDRILIRQGQIGPGHALEVTIRSLPLWTHDSWGFVVIGYAQGDYVDHLKDIARELGVEERFVVLPPVGYDDVPAFIAGAHAGAALYEPTHVNNVHISFASNKLMEHLAVGIPAVLSDTGAGRRFEERYRCVVLADESDPASIARAVNAIFASEAHRVALGAAGRRAFEDVLCYERQMQPLLDLLGNPQEAGLAGARSPAPAGPRRREDAG